MTDTDEYLGDLEELLKIANVGKKKIEALYYSGYRTLKDLVGAPPEELEKVPGIGKELADEIIDFVSLTEKPEVEKDEEDVGDGSWHSDGAPRLYLCPMCGSLIPKDATRCDNCGIVFEGEEEIEERAPEMKDKSEDGFWYKEEQGIFMCPNCGSFITEDAKNCSECGIVFSDEVPEIEAEATPETNEKDAGDGFWYGKETPQLFMCPGCGALIPSDAVKCGHCGVEFDGEEEVDDTPPDAEKKEGGEDDFWYKEQRGLFICPNCGAFISEEANNCQVCGIVFEADEEEPEVTPETEDLICPLCNAKLESGTETCPSCGFHFKKDEPDSFWYKDQTSLFICPNCGAFIPETANHCSQCGVVFEGVEDEEAAPEPKVPVKEEELDLSLLICPTCGAFVSESADKCTVCGSDLDAALKEKVEELDFQLPKIPDKVAAEIQAELDEIDSEIFELPKKEIEGLELPKEEKRGISKDFLTRWKKRVEPEEEPAAIAPKKRWETAELTDEEIEKELELDFLTVPEKSEERLEEINRAIEAEPHNDKLWAEKASMLLVLERQDEAIASLDMAAELNPEKETEYKKRILEVLGVGAEEEDLDLSELISIEEDGEISLEEEQIQSEAEDRIVEVDRLLEENPEDEGLWQEKGELLETLGRHDEAIKCFDESIRLSYVDLQDEADGVTLSLKQPEILVGLTNGQGRVNGWVNGLLTQRGLINGMGKINGLVNGGLVNGLVNGRVNGRGRVNGLINGGLINGLVNGRVNGRGRVNGLINGGMINGQGLINGRGRFYGARRMEIAKRSWRYRVSWIIILVALVLIAPMFANLLSQPTGAIHIDGDFSDWNAFTSFQDSMGDQTSNPDLNIIETKMVSSRNRVNVFLRVEDIALGGRSSNGFNRSVDGIFVFIDVDSDTNTGYLIEGLGADMKAEIYGWNNGPDSCNAFRFDETGDHNDWNSFVKGGSVICAVLDSEVELGVTLPHDLTLDTGDAPTVLAIITNSEGYFDKSDSLMSPLPATLDFRSFGRGADILAPGTTNLELMRVETRSYASSCQLLDMNFTVTGEATFDHLSNIRLVNDTNLDGNFNPLTDGNLAITVQSMNTKNFTLSLVNPLAVPTNKSFTFFLVSDLIADPSGSTIGLEMTGASAADALTVVNNLDRKIHNLGTPAGMQVDGAFGDWAGIRDNVDPANDVLEPNYNFTTINKNVDLADARFEFDDSLFVYFSVSGVMLGGSDIPTIKLRPGPSAPPIEDSDRDRVPDVEDPMPLDFNNNGVNDTDEPNNSIDDDDVRDYDRGGTDWWLNTTIPTDFPVNYSGMNVSIYIGPIKYVENTGEDQAYVLIDSDDDPMTGAVTLGAIGADHVIIVTGKGSEITTSELFRYDPLQSGIPWAFVENVPSAIDWYRMELEVETGTLGIAPGDNFTVFISLKDWKGDYDIADQPLDSEDISSRRSLTGTRAPKPKIDFSKDVDKATAGPGDILTYTIRYACSRSTAYDVVITETYPAGVTFVGATPSPTVGDNQWYIGTLDPGDSGVITITVVVDDNVMDGDLLENYAQVDYTDGGPWQGTKWDRARTRVVIVPELPQVSLAIFGLMIIGFIGIRRRKKRYENERNERCR